MRARLSLWLPPLVYMAVIFYLSSQPHPLTALTERVWDKILHTTEYAVLGVLLYRALLGEGLEWKRAAAVAILLTSAYALSDEWHQMFTPGRSSDIRDWVADTLGGTVGTAAYGLIHRRLTFARARRVEASTRRPGWKTL